MITPINNTFHFPDEIKDLISSLKNRQQWRILELLIDNDNKLSYTQIRLELGIQLNKKGTLNYHLNELEKGGWLRNRSEGSNLTDRYNSYYSISEFGMKAIQGTMQAMKKSTYANKTTPNEIIVHTGKVNPDIHFFSEGKLHLFEAKSSNTNRMVHPKFKAQLGFEAKMRFRIKRRTIRNKSQINEPVSILERFVE